MNSTCHKQRGFITLAISSLLLALVTATSFYSVESLIMEQRIISNQYQTEQAKHAAEAGLDHAQAYLITQGPSGITDGYIITGSLPNSSSYSVQMNFVNGSNGEIEVLSTGTSSDSVVSKIFREKSILIGGIGAIGFDEPVKATGSVSMSGNADIINLLTNYTIHSGLGILISGNAETSLASGVGSNSSALGSDVVYNDAVLAAMSDDALFDSHFGVSFADILQPGVTTLTYSGAGDYSTALNGISGEVVEINAGSGKVTLGGSGTIGTAVSPVTLVINAAELNLKSSVTVNGNIIVSGELTSQGNFKGQVNGSIKTGGNAQLTGNAEVNGDVLSGGEINISGGGVINGVAFAADSAAISGSGTINGAVLVGGPVSMPGDSAIIYNQSNITSYSGGGGGTEYTRMIGSWQSF